MGFNVWNMYMDIIFISLILFIIIIEGVAQYFIQKHIDMKEQYFLILGLILYSVVAYVYYHILRRGQKIVVATTIWAAGSIIISSFTGWFLFNQKLTMRMAIGLMLVFVGAYLII